MMKNLLALLDRKEYVDPFMLAAVAKHWNTMPTREQWEQLEFDFEEQNDD